MRDYERSRRWKPDRRASTRSAAVGAATGLFEARPAFLEIGHDQREAVLALAERLLPGAHDVAVREDYHGRDRLLIIGF